MVTDHGWFFAFNPVKLHNQHPAIVVIPFEESPDKLGCPFPVDDGVQWVERPECVPKGEIGIVVEICCCIDLPVCAVKLPVGIHVNIGMDHRMIKRGIKQDLLRLGSPFNLNFAQLLIPCFSGLLPDLIKVPTFEFRFQIISCPFNADHGYSDL